MSGHGLRLISRRPAAAATTENRAVAFAWLVHKAQATWANNADVKASILLALDAGAVYAAVSALSDGGFLARPGGRETSVAVAVGVSALLLAIGAAAIAIFPRLGNRRAAVSRRSHVIYFGDLRRWQAAELSAHLAGLTEDDELDMLSRQLTEMARQNWAKHRWVQLSLVLSLAGILMIAVPALIAA